VVDHRQQQQQQQQQLHIGRLLSTVQGGPLLCWIHGDDDNGNSSSSSQQQITTDATASGTANDIAATAIDDDITQHSPSILLIDPKVDTVLQQYDVPERPLQDVCYITSSTTAETTYTAYVLHGKGTVSRLVMSYEDLGIPAVQIQPQTVTGSNDISSDARTADDVVAVVTDIEQQQQENTADSDVVSSIDDASTAAAAAVPEGRTDDASEDADTDDTLQHSSGQSSSDAALMANSTYALQQAEAILIANRPSAPAVTPAVATAAAVDTECESSSSDNSAALDSSTALHAEAANDTARIDNRTIMLQQSSNGNSFSSSSDGLLSPTLKELLHDTDALILETHTALNNSETTNIASSADYTAPTAIEVCLVCDVLQISFSS
jgi:hypothetical protein